MATATKEMIPFIPSSAKGPLGAAHLPRLWTKLTLGNAGMLAEGWDYCGHGFDEMTINGLGLHKDRVVEYVKASKPTYVQFEEWVVANGKTDKATIEQLNAAIRGYHHSDELAQKMRGSSKVKDSSIKDAVTLNTIEDLDEVHAQLKL